MTPSDLSEEEVSAPREMLRAPPTNPNHHSGTAVTYTRLLATLQGSKGGSTAREEPTTTFSLRSPSATRTPRTPLASSLGRWDV